MTLYFDPNPTPGQEEVIGDITYVWDDVNGVWNAKNTTSGESYTKAEADDRFVNVTGDAMTGVLSMGDNPIQNLRTPVGDYEAANLYSVVSEANKKVDKRGDVMTGDLQMSGKIVKGITGPTLDDDAVNKKYSDDEDEKLDNKKVDRTGDKMSGNLSLLDATNDPLVITAPGHATTKAYVDQAIADAVSSPISFKGTIDASVQGPDQPAVSGDLYIHDTGTNNPVTPVVDWNLPPGTEVEDLDRLIFDDNGVWNVLKVAGNYVVKTGGDSMEGPLTVTAQDGDSDSRTNNKINTLGVFSPGSSDLHLGYNNDTKLYVGGSAIESTVPFKTDEISPRPSRTKTLYTGDVDEDKCIATKEYVDGLLDTSIGEFEYAYAGNAGPGLLTHMSETGPCEPENLTHFILTEKDLQNNDLTDDQFEVDHYIHLQTNRGDSYYRVTEAIWSGPNANPGWELKTQHIVGDDFEFINGLNVMIETGNVAGFIEVFAPKQDPEFSGTVTLDEGKIVTDYRESSANNVELWKHLPSNLDDTNQTTSIILANGGGNIGGDSSKPTIQTSTLDIQGWTSSNKFQVRGKSNGRDPLLEVRADGTVKSFTNISLEDNKITNLADATEDGDAVSLGYITEALQEKFEELIGQSAQGSYAHSTTAVPGTGKFSAFDNNSNLLTDSFYDISQVTKLSFHETDRDNHTVDFSALNVGDFILLVIDTYVTRFRVEAPPVPQNGVPVDDIVVSHISGGKPGNNTDNFNIASVQFQIISGSVDLDDYVQKDGSTTMTGALKVDRGSGLGIDIKKDNATKFSVDVDGTTKVFNSIELSGGLDFQSDSRFIKIEGNNRINLRTATSGGTVLIPRPGDNQQGFTLAGNTVAGATINGTILNLFHGGSTDEDAIFYRGKQHTDECLATMAVVNDKVKIDGSSTMTGNLNIAMTAASSEPKLYLKGNQTDNTKGFAALQFENSQGGGLDYLVARGKDNNSRYFKFTAPVTIARHKGSDGRDHTVLEGRVGNTSSTSGRLLSTYLNTGANGGDAINYYGKTSNNDNVQTKKSVEALVSGMFKYAITESGGQYFIEAI